MRVGLRVGLLEGCAGGCPSGMLCCCCRFCRWCCCPAAAAAKPSPVPPLPALSAALTCLHTCLLWLLQMEAERQHKIREEVKHELRVFYCEARTLCCACYAAAVGV